MAFVYILFSDQLNRFYIGSCKDLSARIIQHINQEFKKSFTSKARDWGLYISIEGLEYEQARQIELYIKKMKSKKHIQNLKKYPGLIEKLKRNYSNGDSDSYGDG